MSKIDLISNEWTDLVFEGRNQAYGAYKLRKGTAKRNVWALIIVGLAAALLYLGLQLQKMAEANKKVENTQAVELAKLNTEKKEAKVEKKEIIKQEPEKVVEQVKSSVKFTAPIIKKDSEVKEEDEIKLDEVQKSDKAVGAFTVEGNDEVGGAVLKAKEDIAAPEPPKHVVEETKIFTVVEQMPMFPGGDGALMGYLRDNIHYPTVAAENGVQGRVVVGFVVERDGSITDVNILRGVDPSLDREAMRVVKSMPKWTPGKQNGSAVRVKYQVPVSFRLQ
ncbi:energy transducer TonB [Prevotella sp.]|jgi:protein TonB|uniref:energy transducer TonB n=1 Tax=Prevotella sp. TaxID=59823 RepID=UPI0025E17514|nr:energy transducer TonB [Prevotella sp.]MBD9246608.1 energy transducer TonB [Prevotella sp.]